MRPQENKSRMQQVKNRERLCAAKKQGQQKRSNCKVYLYYYPADGKGNIKLESMFSHAWA